MTHRLLLPASGALLTLALLPLATLQPAPARHSEDLRQLAARQSQWIRTQLARVPDDPTARLPLRASQRGDRGLPPPTENWLPDDAEKNQKQRRKRWLRDRHRAPAGMDWKTIDRANGKAQAVRRATLAAAAQTALEAGAPLPVRADSAEGSWVERGSDNQAGRMHAARVTPDGSLLVAGSSKGGVWTLDLTSEDAAWTPIADALYGGSQWLALIDTAPSKDTGARDTGARDTGARDTGARDTGARDTGAKDSGTTVSTPPVIVAATDWAFVNRSDDLGQTWTEASLADSPSSLTRLVTMTDGSGVVFAATGSNRGHQIQRSTDGGLSFQTVADLGSYQGDVFVPRDGSSRIYVAAGTELWSSDDLGDSWAVAGTFPGGAQGVLAGSEAGAPTLYAMINQSHLWRSDDVGLSWQDMGAVADFWGRMAASMIDPQVVVWGGMELYRSTDGGTTQRRVNQWSDYYDHEADRLHADIMGVEVVSDGKGGETWLIGTDGGLYESTDQLSTVNNLSLRGLRVSQYYDTLTDSHDATKIAAGAQDQGYQVSIDPLTTGNFDLYDFDQALSGDYAHLVSGDGSHEMVFSVYPGFILVQLGDDGASLSYAEFPNAESGRYYAWLPPLAADPDDPSAFYFCATRLYHYTFDGYGWQSEQWSDENFSQNSYEFLSAFKLAPSDPSRAYAATSYGRLFRSDDGGKTWTESSDNGPYGHYFYGTALVVDPEDPDTAWVGGSGYDAPAVYMTTDGGDTWTDWGDGLPNTLVYGMAMAKDSSRRIFAGADSAAYVRGPADSEWVDITKDEAPITTYWSVETLDTQPTARFGTYGRGIWDFAYIEELPEPSDSGGDSGTGDGGTAAGDDTGTPKDAKGCGCGGGMPAGFALFLPALLAMVRRRRA